MSSNSWKHLHILREIVHSKKREGDSTAVVRRVLGRYSLRIAALLGALLTLSVAGVAGKMFYDASDDDADRGAIAVAAGAVDAAYATPLYIDQGWSPSDSLWFYNTTQGSGLLPYDFFLVLEQPGEGPQALVRSDANIDRFRYLPQKATKFNPDALPVGFVREPYKGVDYMGFTCAACHTGQINYGGHALRIDGGPTLGDMVGFLHQLDKAMTQTLTDAPRRQRFIDNVLALDNSYDRRDDVIADLKRWSRSIRLYNSINHTRRAQQYGYARLDAFGRIYNRVLQHVINAEQAASLLSSVVGPDGRRILSDAEIANVLEGMGRTILVDSQFSEVLERLQSAEPGYPNLGQRDMLRVRNAFFNEPNAPVSYPFLWDIAQSDYVQWNGLANNAGLGPLGRNTGEVIGVFGILDWSEQGPGFDLQDMLAARLSGQSRKARTIQFESSINLHNLRRLESRLRSLQSPLWRDAEQALAEAGVDTSEWSIDEARADRGRLIYRQYCQSCHMVIDRDDWNRLMVARMSSLDAIGTDPAMATNGVSYTGQSGNFQNTIQKTGVGPLVVEQTAPVVQILTSATTGVVATPSDPDKGLLHNIADWIFTVVNAFADNEIQPSNKAGNYNPDTTAAPYASLLSYKARSLNGIWATAPYLHNGSVPTLYDLLLPVKREGDPDDGEYRPRTFQVGSREFDPVRVGYRYTGYQGFTFDTGVAANLNSGHEYAAGRTAQADGVTVLPALNRAQRLDLLEYLKTL